MPLQSVEKLEALKAQNEDTQERIQSCIANRWGSRALTALSNASREPPQVRILIYADGSTELVELMHVRTLLEFGPYPHIKFRVTNAHREESQNEINLINRGPVKLTELNIRDDFDEIWFFGARPSQALEPEEIDRLREFMDAPKFGGVLVTGDHDPLGILAKPIPRVGEMRRWDVAVSGPNKYSSLVEGPDENLSLSGQDESDDVPQTIHYRRFPIKATSGVRLRPHPVLCGHDGPIDVLPDHEHEGEAVAPSVDDTNASTWPKTEDGTHQEQPIVIGWGDVKDPQVHYKHFGVISIYNGHNVNVGRIIADSSWHHWLNSNLSGFESTPEGQAVLKRVENYFLNCATWLAPPEVQRQARLTAWVSIMQANEIMEVAASAPLPALGERALKQLRRFASSCAVSEWVLGPDTFNNVMSNPQMSGNLSLLNLSVEQNIAGGILRALMNLTTPSDSDLENAINTGTAEALATIQEQLNSEVLNLQVAAARLQLS